MGTKSRRAAQAGIYPSAGEQLCAKGPAGPGTCSMSEQCAAAKKAWVLGCINKGREESHKHSSCRLSISSRFPRITPPRFASLSHCPENSVCSAAPKAAIAHSAHAAQKLQKGGRGSGSPKQQGAEMGARDCVSLLSGRAGMSSAASVLQEPRALFTITPTGSCSAGKMSLLPFPPMLQFLSPL